MSPSDTIIAKHKTNLLKSISGFLVYIYFSLEPWTDVFKRTSPQRANFLQEKIFGVKVPLSSGSSAGDWDWDLDWSRQPPWLGPPLHHLGFV